MAKKILVLLVLFVFKHNALALQSSATLTLVGQVKVVAQAQLKRLNKLNYKVHELSNNREGYSVMIETNARSVRYDNKLIDIVDGQATLTQTHSQTQTIDTIKDLIFTTEPTYVQITMQVI